ncbi:MAG: sensor histidine kinase, partial [Actinomycetota bacterium]
DTLAQNLAGIALQLDSVTMELADPDGMQESLDQACNLIRYSLSEARRAVSDLHSDELENQELVTFLPEIANKMTINTQLQVNMQITGTVCKLNPVVEKNLLRIFQEALANAVKHSQASHIKIELKYGIDSLILQLRDDGKGFDTESIIPFEVGHFGLIGMRERAERIGGQLTLTSKPGEGTEVTVEMPFVSYIELPRNVRLEH